MRGDGGRGEEKGGGRGRSMTNDSKHGIRNMALCRCCNSDCMVAERLHGSGAVALMPLTLHGNGATADLVMHA